MDITRIDAAMHDGYALQTNAVHPRRRSKAAKARRRPAAPPVRSSSRTAACIASIAHLFALVDLGARGAACPSSCTRFSTVGTCSPKTAPSYLAAGSRRGSPSDGKRRRRHRCTDATGRWTATTAGTASSERIRGHRRRRSSALRTCGRAPQPASRRRSRTGKTRRVRRAVRRRRLRAALKPGNRTPARCTSTFVRTAPASSRALASWKNFDTFCFDPRRQKRLRPRPHTRA